MVEQIRLVVVTVDGHDFSFRARFHRAEKPEEQLIEPAFYQTQGQGVHEGVHYELELIDVPEVASGNPRVHIHRNPDSKLDFVCFTGNIPNLDVAQAVFRVWCLGTTYTLVFDEDFGPIVNDHPTDFAEYMRDRHWITVSSDIEYGSP